MRSHLYRWRNVLCHTVVDDKKNFKNPRHKDLADELKSIAQLLENGENKIFSSIEFIWNCEEVNQICNSLCSTISDHDVAFRAERALKVAKWLFIEQDITDWHTSGRVMLLNGIKKALNIL